MKHHASEICLARSGSHVSGGVASLEPLPKGHTSLGLQELCLLDKEAPSFHRAASQAGWNLFQQSGGVHKGRWGNSVAEGGVALLVPKHLPRKPFGGDTARRGTLLLVSFYAPPGEDYVASTMLADLHTQAALNRASWVMAGDANGEPQDCDILAALEGLGGVVVSDKAPTRWGSSRCVDRFVASRLSLLSWQGHLAEHLSDHIAIEASLHVPLQPRWQGRLRPTPTWSRPQGVSQVRREALHKAWTQQDVSHLTGLLRHPEVQTQVEWDEFWPPHTKLPRKMLRSRVVRSSLRRCKPGARTNKKGRVAAWQECTQPVQPGRPRRVMQDCKCSRRLARLYQLIRLLQTPAEDDRACHEQETSSLCAKLQMAQEGSRADRIRRAEACIIECKREWAEREQLAQRPNGND